MNLASTNLYPNVICIWMQFGRVNISVFIWVYIIPHKSIMTNRQTYRHTSQSTYTLTYIVIHNGLQYNAHPSHTSSIETNRKKREKRKIENKEKNNKQSTIQIYFKDVAVCTCVALLCRTWSEQCVKKQLDNVPYTHVSLLYTRHIYTNACFNNRPLIILNVRSDILNTCILAYL